ncbi:MAG: hypothetical protein HOV81_41630 [Kofleriaceae bacterium]|nr:hypothetical protein [Kofleriaceae bacterium]
MATLDRGDGISKIAVDAGLTFLDDPYDLALRLELYGQYVTRSGFGIYGSLPLTMSFGAPEDNPDVIPNDATALGNLEAGGLYVLTKSRELSFVFHGGVSFPTAGDDRDEAATLRAGIWPRLTDLANTTGLWYLRFGFSPLFYASKFFLRGDLGFDIALEEAGAHFLRFNIGAGVDLGAVALSLELVNSLAFIEHEDNEFFDDLALTVRFMGKTFQPYLAVGTPLDDSRDNVDLFIAGGLQFVP